MASPHILLVDDDQRFRRELIEYLEDYSVIQASSGEDALRLLAQSNEIDLVILDVMMPGLDGIHVLKRMKQMSPDLGIIILDRIQFQGDSNKSIERACGRLCGKTHPSSPNKK